MATFKSRMGNMVVVSTGTQDVNVSLATPEQAELYELVLTAKVYSKQVAFSQDMIRVKKPSPKQMACVQKIIAQTHAYHAKTNAAVAVPPAVETVDITKVMAMFSNARQHLKRPKITLLLDNPTGFAAGTVSRHARKVRFSLNEFRGRLYMNGDTYGLTYGWINIGNHELVLRQAGNDAKTELMDLLKVFCAEPEKTAILHGKLTGNCCFCSLPLSDPRSLNMGYGPICAEHWHLPWGEKSPFTAEGDWVLNGKVAP